MRKLAVSMLKGVNTGKIESVRCPWSGFAATVVRTCSMPPMLDTAIQARAIMATEPMANWTRSVTTTP